MSQSVFTEPVGRFLLGEVLARTGAVDLMIDGLAIGLTGNTAFPVNHLNVPIQHHRNGFVDPGSIVWKHHFCLVRDVQNGSTEGDPSRGFSVLCEGVAFPVVGCYHCHCSIPLREGLAVGLVMIAWRLWSQALVVSLYLLRSFYRLRFLPPLVRTLHPFWSLRDLRHFIWLLR